MRGWIEKALEGSGVPFTHLRAGEFMAAYFRQIPNVSERGILAVPMGDARIASIDTADVADVAVEVLTGRGHEGAVYRLTGP